MADTFADLADHRTDLIRKGLNVAIFVAPYDVDDEIEEILDSSGDLNVPSGYNSVGLIEKDQGASWSSDVDTSDVQSNGHSEPTRRDIVSDVQTLVFTAQEAKALTFELYEGIDLSDVTASSAGDNHSTVSYDRPDRPASRYWRVLALAKDGEGADAVYQAKWLPKAQVTDKGDLDWKEEDEEQRQITLTAFFDAEFGTAMRTLWGIPSGLVEAMGFDDGES